VSTAAKKSTCTQQCKNNQTIAQQLFRYYLVIIIIQAFVKRAMSANTLNLRRRQLLGEEDGGSEV